jgi:hypothetical protein
MTPGTMSSFGSLVLAEFLPHTLLLTTSFAFD